MAAHQGGRGYLKPIEFSNTSALADWLSHDCLPEGYILLDGFPGSGKSTLAAKLAKSMQQPWCELDALLNGSQIVTSYVDLLTDEDLRDFIDTNRTAILDGVTILDVAKKFSLPVKAHIYVKRIDKYGFWSDEDEIKFSNPIDAIISPSALRLCLREYHKRSLPHEKCDALLTWGGT
ncbi:hypothetical protein EGY25_13995 [Brevundimonas intermedia]|uniref:Uncharacterized protein n=1 Tax=Brevundimonas intermedia TaxID=74315 RepID=A0A4Y9RW23_9CAUL|nr:hypothetical protein [Brevundimonas intermedia]TFW13073.1 hypothetical protein EGY25_13995 [Brevundimonas intermedia]